MKRQVLSRLPEGAIGRSERAPDAIQPIATEILYRDPLDLYAPFAGDPHAVLLESAMTGGDRGRYSYIAMEPFQVLSSKDGNISLGERRFQGNPFAVLDAEVKRFELAPLPGLPALQGGAVGYFGYELAQHLERVPMARADDMRFADLMIGFHDVIIAVDHVEHRAWVISSGLPEAASAERNQRAVARLNQVLGRLQATRSDIGSASSGRDVNIESNFLRPAYETAVQRVVDYIFAGDIFQANLSQRFRVAMPPGFSGIDLYHRLRSINPAPFAALIKSGDTEIVSASPERFLRLRQGKVETCPIKGTRPRGSTPAADRALASELLASEKDRAENVMIVDLLRNDLSRVCRDGTVEVPKLCELETFATVFHLVSTVTGDLQPGKSAVDLLAACFPGGSITGAPKIRAMEIIAELEPTRRGPYCGSIGYIGFDGSMDTSITIRTYAIKDGIVTFQAGGGIVADSKPADEYDETIAKARALISALTEPTSGS